MDYFSRIQKSIDFIEANLKEGISLEDISVQAYSSVPHFYRMFQITTGYSVMDYVRRRRLSQAAYELLTTEKRVIDIALDFQFNSEETFIRAFVKMFGATPGKYRRLCNVHDLFAKVTLNNQAIVIRKEEFDMEPDFIRRGFMLAGIEEEVDFNGNFVKTITSLQKRLFNKLHSIKNAVNPDSFIAYWYYKSAEGCEVPACCYLAAVEVSSLEDIPERLTVKVIPDSNFAVFNEKRRGEVAGPNGYAYRIWLPTTDRELNEDIPGDFEIYSDRRNIGPDSPCRIYIPVK